MDETLATLPDDDVVNRSFALAMAAATSLEAAERDPADAALDEMLELADCHDIAVLTLNATTSRTWLAALRGDLAEASRLATEALALARHDPVATNGVALQFAYIAWQQGRFADLLPFIEQLDSRLCGSVTKRVMTARALASLDQRDDALALLESIGRSEIEALPEDMLWSSTLVLAAEVAFMLGCKGVGACVRDLLEPFRGLVAVANFVLAPIAYGAGLAAAAARHRDVDALFDEALDLSRRLDAPVLQARTEIAWTVARHAAGAAGAADLAMAHDARAICHERHLTHLGASSDATSWRLH
jgi:hypothetical protein